MEEKEEQFLFLELCLTDRNYFKTIPKLGVIIPKLFLMMRTTLSPKKLKFLQQRQRQQQQQQQLLD